MQKQKADGKRAGIKKLEKGIVETKKHTKEKDRRVKKEMRMEWSLMERY